MGSPEIQNVDWCIYNEGLLAKLGPTYNGRHLIVPDGPVTGGVLFAEENDPKNPEEALVVDATSDPEPYDTLYKRVLDGVSVGGVLRRERLLGGLYFIVGAAMTKSRDGVFGVQNRVAAEHGQGQFVEGTEINLARFLREGIAVCRHYAAGTCWVLERFKDEGRLPDDYLVSLDSNLVTYTDGSQEGHAWARFGERSKPFISDPAERFYASVWFAHEQRHAVQPPWPYWRAEDVARFSRR
jgi:hypothetical protein